MALIVVSKALSILPNSFRPYIHHSGSSSALSNSSTKFGLRLGALKKRRCLNSVRALDDDYIVFQDNDNSDIDESVIPSGEWPKNLFSANIEDLSSHYWSSLNVDEAQQAGLKGNAKDDEDSTMIIANEWPSCNFSNYIEDLAMHYESNLNKAKESEETEPLYPSGEWPETIFSPNYDDLLSYYVPQKFSDKIDPKKSIIEYMQTNYGNPKIGPHNLVSEVVDYFDNVSSLPVLVQGNTCVGLLTKEQVLNSSLDFNTRVGDVMISPPISLSVKDSIKDAAILMVKHNLCQLPILNEKSQLLGVVKRNHIFSPN